METEAMSVNFSGMFKNPAPAGVADGQQKVICTPEVSLYQYPGTEGKLKEAVQLPGEEKISAKEGSNGFQCGICGKTFHQKNTFQNHLRSHREGDDPYQCDICNKTFAVPARLTRHYRTHTGEKPYQCEYCNKSFSVKENLSVHRRIHTKERPYKCEVCERAFEHSGKLHRHMRIHTGERPHRCTICQKTFIQSGQLVIHMRTHTGEKPYVCKVCNKGFTCSKQLKVHTRTHTGEKPYTCDICGKSFGYNHVLKLHQVAHYGEKVYKCTLCNGTFNSKKALETHIKTHSSDGSQGNISPPPTIEPGVLSPSSLSQTPQHSDKENRGESSDSEISSQNSPTLDSPKSPPSPMSEDMPRSGMQDSIHHKIISQGNHQNFQNSRPTIVSNGNSKPINLPHPMLPPTVQVHQAPQSRTTFLYVTSKLPPHGYNSSGNNNLNSPPPGNSMTKNLHSSAPYSPPSQPRVIATNSLNLKSLQIGLTSPPSKLSTGMESPERDPRDKFLQSASIRDKVLASIEKFGYGLGGSGISISPATKNDHPSEYRDNNGYASNYYNRNNNRADIHEVENLSKFGRSDVSISEVGRQRNRSQSPDRGTYNPGSVLALALAKGSKAVNGNNGMNHNHMPQQHPFFPNLPSVTIRPRANSNSNSAQLNHYDSPNSNRSSPEIIGVRELSRSSVSPPGGMDLAYYRPTPSSTPGSSGSYSENTEDGSSDDYHHHQQSSPSPPYPEKRSGSSSSSYGGPRKRSSLILEKYAQENSPPPASSSPKPESSPSPPLRSTESILSQRLRLSSVIQYAEKCT